MLCKKVMYSTLLTALYVFELTISKIHKIRQKRSAHTGLCISTGTGSTSWTFNINKLTQQSVEKLLRIVFETTHFPINWKDERLVEAVTQKFNNEIVFDPERNMMAYTLRDPVSVGIFPGEGGEKGRGARWTWSWPIEIFYVCFSL